MGDGQKDSHFYEYRMKAVVKIGMGLLAHRFQAWKRQNPAYA
jgi:hypothetical protein